MDDVCRRDCYGGCDVGGGDVPIVASDYEVGSMVFEYWGVGFDWFVLCYCDCAVDILYHYRHRGKSWDLDIPKVICGCRICELFFFFSFPFYFSFLSLLISCTLPPHFFSIFVVCP